MKRIVVLGSTGSIGRQTLDIVRQHPDRLRVVGLAANRNIEELRKQAKEFQTQNLALMEDVGDPDIPHGIDAITRLAEHESADIVVVAVAGVIGLRPTLAAIEAGKMIALASKEVLVAAGEVVMPLVTKHSTTMTPIDSEHSAVFQCLQGYTPQQLDSLILTASGGPFRGKKREELQGVTVADALNHPTWRMGGKITIDSATLMNKGLELIEAHWLFDAGVEKVDVVVHPQSIVHSFIKLKDGSVLGQLGWPDMRLPIQYALLYPDRIPNELPPWNPLDSPKLDFFPVDNETFPAINLARAAAKEGGTMPNVFNAANEEAANAFLQGRCGFLEITEIVERVMQAHTRQPAVLEAIFATDKWARETARTLMPVG